MCCLWGRESDGRQTVRMPSSKVDQNKCIEELGDIEFDNSLADTVYCSAALRSQYRSVVGNSQFAIVLHFAHQLNLHVLW